MEVFEKFSKLIEKYKNSVYAIGNFDGLHLGHKALIDQALSISKKSTSKDK